MHSGFSFSKQTCDENDEKGGSRYMNSLLSLLVDCGVFGIMVIMVF
jgi:hypothetical protein